MGNFVRHEPCPKCGSRDNLARYEDGSAHCFGGCGHWEPPSRLVIEKIKEKPSVQLSVDLCSDFPRHVVEWLGKYDVSVQEALKHGWKYSPSRDQLVFVFNDRDGNLVTQARNFSPFAKSKYFNSGNTEAVLPIFRAPVVVDGPRRLAAVEDVVSAARIGRQCDAMPCLGSSLSKQKMMRLRVLYDLLFFWLDADKLNESRALAEQAKWLGFETRVVYTPLDPKEYSDGEITNALRC